MRYTMRAGKTVAVFILAVVALVAMSTPAQAAKPGTITTIAVVAGDLPDGGPGVYPDCDFTITVGFATVRKADWRVEFTMLSYEVDHYAVSGSGSTVIPKGDASVAFTASSYTNWHAGAANHVSVRLFKPTRQGEVQVDAAQTPLFFTPASGCPTGGTWAV